MDIEVRHDGDTLIISSAEQRVGSPHVPCDPEKIIAVVESKRRDKGRAFAEQDAPLPEGEFVESPDAMLSQSGRFERLRERWFAFLDSL